MPHTPADILLPEAAIYLAAKGVEVWIDFVEGRWRYIELDSEIIARAFALGLAGHPVVQ